MDGLDDGCSGAAVSDGRKDGVSSAAMLRKSNKPMMEKKRRERINKCLDQLKNILMEVTKKESSYYSKLEKADILEMTVKYLKNLKRHTATTTTTTTTDCSTDNEALCKYVAGFNECAKEVTQYLTSVGGGDVSVDARTSLLGHLADSLQHRAAVQPTPVNSFRTAVTPCPSVTPSPYAGTGSDCSCSPPSPRTVDITSTTVLPPTSSLPLPSSAAVYVINPQTGSTSPTGQPMQLLPARLPSGEIVFLLTTPPSFASTSMNLTSSPSDVGVLPVMAADSTLHSPQWSASTQETEKETKFCIEPSRSKHATSGPVVDLGATSSTDDNTAHENDRVPFDGVPILAADCQTAVSFKVEASTVSGSCAPSNSTLRPLSVGCRLAQPFANAEDVVNPRAKIFDVGAAAAAAAAEDRENNNCVMEAADADRHMWRPW